MTPSSRVPTPWRHCVTPPAGCLRNQRHKARRAPARAAAGLVGPAGPVEPGCGRCVGAVCCMTVPGWQLLVPSQGMGMHPRPSWAEGVTAEPYLLLAGLPDLLHLLITALHLLGVGLPQPLHLHLQPQLRLQMVGMWSE